MIIIINTYKKDSGLVNKNNDLKPMLNIDELINNLKEKNIKFNKMTEEEVKLYLKTNNNYYNVI